MTVGPGRTSLPSRPRPGTPERRQPGQGTAKGGKRARGSQTPSQAPGRGAGEGQKGRLREGAAAARENGGSPGAGDWPGQGRRKPGRRPRREQGRAGESLTGLGRAASSPPPSRRRPRPRPPPPPRAARSVPAARLGRSAPPLSSACSCSRQRATLAAAPRADDGPGAPAAAAALLRSIVRAAAAAAADPGSAFAFAFSRLPEVRSLPGRAAPRSRPSPALTCALRRRRRRDVGRHRNAPFGLGRPLAAGRTRRRSPPPRPKREGKQEKQKLRREFLFFHPPLKYWCSAPSPLSSTLPEVVSRSLSRTTSSVLNKDLCQLRLKADFM